MASAGCKPITGVWGLGVPNVW